MWSALILTIWYSTPPEDALKEHGHKCKSTYRQTIEDMIASSTFLYKGSL